MSTARKSTAKKSSMTFANAFQEQLTRLDPLRAVENPTIDWLQYPLLGLCSQGTILLLQDKNCFSVGYRARQEAGFPYRDRVGCQSPTVVIATISRPWGIHTFSIRG